MVLPTHCDARPLSRMHSGASQGTSRSQPWMMDAHRRAQHRLLPLDPTLRAVCHAHPHQISPTRSTLPHTPGPPPRRMPRLRTNPPSNLLGLYRSHLHVPSVRTTSWWRSLRKTWSGCGRDEGQERIRGTTTLSQRGWEAWVVQRGAHSPEIQASRRALVRVLAYATCSR